ncbi:MAG: hypothetical protein HC763_29085 [Hydrococcus sp. CRU_1_1]|jgi:hypothetical protein|nr:hypothetical protein [Hydrococcus sp. CRU_1_1]
MSSPPLRVFLTITQEKTLFELSRADRVPHWKVIDWQMAIASIIVSQHKCDRR